jgi:hypothetical protein
MNSNKKMECSEANGKTVCKIGGIAALFVVAVAVCEMAVTFLPGGSESVETVADWFGLLQNNCFMGLRNLGLLNILLIGLGVVVYFALYTAHRDVNRTMALLAMIISLVGAAVFFATNRAFAMLELSHQYAQAATEVQQSTLLAAGQGMLAVGRSHSPGTFLGFFIGEVAGLVMSGVMLQGRIFGKVTAVIGIVSFSLFIIFEVWTAFVPVLLTGAMLFAGAAGILNVIWHFLLGRRLLHLAKS